MNHAVHVLECTAQPLATGPAGIILPVTTWKAPVLRMIHAKVIIPAGGSYEPPLNQDLALVEIVAEKPIPPLLEQDRVDRPGPVIK